MDPSHWNKSPVYMLDFEGSTTSGVVEFGVVKILNGEILSTQTDMCAPVGLISDRDLEVHGIHQSRVSDLPVFSTYYELFVGFRRDGVFAAHNRHAENSFLKSTWAVPPKVPDWRRGVGFAQEWGPWVDTLAIYKRLYPDLESCALSELVQIFGIRDELSQLAELHCPAERRRPHCALYDALASTLLLLRLGQDEKIRPYLNLGWLLEFSGGYSPQTELF